MNRELPDVQAGFRKGRGTRDQSVKNLPAVQETWVRSLVWEDPLEKETAAHSSILAWKISWTEEPGGLQSMGSQRVRHDWATNTHTHTRRWSCYNQSMFASMSSLSLLPSACKIFKIYSVECCFFTAHRICFSITGYQTMLEPMEGRACLRRDLSVISLTSEP